MCAVVRQWQERSYMRILSDQVLRRVFDLEKGGVAVERVYE